MLSLFVIICSLLFIKITHRALPVSINHFTNNKKLTDKEAILSTSASLTTETAVVLPLFLFLFFSLTSFFQILGMQLTFQIQLEETARKINSFSYLISNTGTLNQSSEKNSETAELSKNIADNKHSQFLTNIFSSVLLKQLFLTNDIRKLCDSMLVNGSNGLSFSKSNYDTQNQTLDILITYYVDIPFLPDKLSFFHFVQRCHFKLWNGLPENTNKNLNQKIVYVTKDSSVYHTQKYCSYLIRYANVIPFSELHPYEASVQKNLTSCPVCCKYAAQTSTSLVYIAKTGTVYHLSRDCYYLTSHIYEFDFNSIPESYRLCSRCETTQ